MPQSPKPFLRNRWTGEPLRKGFEWEQPSARPQPDPQGEEMAAALQLLTAVAPQQQPTTINKDGRTLPTQPGPDFTLAPDDGNRITADDMDAERDHSDPDQVFSFLSNDESLFKSLMRLLQGGNEPAVNQYFNRRFSLFDGPTRETADHPATQMIRNAVEELKKPENRGLRALLTGSVGDNARLRVEMVRNSILRRRAQRVGQKARSEIVINPWAVRMSSLPAVIEAFPEALNGEAWDYYVDETGILQKKQSSSDGMTKIIYTKRSGEKVPLEFHDPDLDKKILSQKLIGEQVLILVSDGNMNAMMR